MPTIEVVSVLATGLPSLPLFDSLEAKMETQSTIESHRALFSDRLKALSGVIVHLGNPDLDPREESGWWAGYLIDWDHDGPTSPSASPRSPRDHWGSEGAPRFRFTSNARVDIARLIDLAIQASPVSRVVLLTDYQFGPALGTVVDARSPAELWREHDAVGLRWNHLYDLEL